MSEKFSCLEEAIAVSWILDTEFYLENQLYHLVEGFKGYFAKTISKWEENGKLRPSHRKILLGKARSYAIEHLQDGAFPLTRRSCLESLENEHRYAKNS